MLIGDKDIKGDKWSVHQIEDTSPKHAGMCFVAFLAEDDAHLPGNTWYSDPFRSLTALTTTYPQVREIVEKYLGQQAERLESGLS